MSAAPHFVSKPLLFGKTEWRIIVIDSYWGERTTLYEWLDDGGLWRDQRDWPRYNGNDTYNGLPRTLRVLWDREKRAVFQALGKPLPPEQQMALF